MPWHSIALSKSDHDFNTPEEMNKVTYYRFLYQLSQGYGHSEVLLIHTASLGLSDVLTLNRWLDKCQVCPRT